MGSNLNNNQMGRSANAASDTPRASLSGKLLSKLLSFGRNWFARSAMKLGYIAGAALTALLIRHGGEQASATQLGDAIAAAIGTAIMIGIEFTSSWLSHKARPIPKALPVGDDET